MGRREKTRDKTVTSSIFPRRYRERRKESRRGSLPSPAETIEPKSSNTDSGSRRVGAPNASRPHPPDVGRAAPPSDGPPLPFRPRQLGSHLFSLPLPARKGPSTGGRRAPWARVCLSLSTVRLLWPRSTRGRWTTTTTGGTGPVGPPSQAHGVGPVSSSTPRQRRINMNSPRPGYAPGDRPSRDGSVSPSAPSRCQGSGPWPRGGPRASSAPRRMSGPTEPVRPRQDLCGPPDPLQ